MATNRALGAMRAFPAILAILALAGVSHAEELPAWLAPEFEPRTELRERALVAREAPVRVLAGARATAKIPAGTELVVLESAGGDVHVLVQDRLARVAVHVDPAFLATVAREGAVIVARDGAGAIEARTPGVRLRAGTRLDVDRRGAVTYRDATNGVEVRGRLPAGAYGKTFTGGAAPARLGGEIVDLRAGTRVLDAPGGRPLATLRRAISASGLEARDGHTLIELAVEPAVLVGWVPDARVGGSGGARGRSVEAPRVGIPGVARSDAPGAVAVARGDLLHAAPDGAPVGVVLHESRLAPAGAPDGWAGVEVPTEHGTFRLYLRARAP